MVDGKFDENSVFLGIDPGANGCIAAADYSGCVIYHTRIPDDPGELQGTLVDMAGPNLGGCVVEKVGVRPYNSRRSCWTFGYSTGVLHACLNTAGIPFTLVLPKVWMKEMDALTGGDKRVSRNRAIELYDGPVTHQSADGILIAEFARRLFRGKLENV